jgi:DNA modification methylase/predicted RNA methylase
MKHYEFHPIAAKFPLDNQGPEFDALVEDIRVNGLQQTIILHKGKILDGRRRYLACQQAGVSPEFGAWDRKGSPFAFVVSANIHRRHLTPGQRAVIGLELFEEEHRNAKDRQRLSKGRGKKGAQRCATSNGKAKEQVARRVGCSTRLIEQIKHVHAEAPKLVADIAAGTLTVAAAAASLKPENSLVLSKTVTPPSVCYWIWKTLTEAGYAPTVILDPAAGAGNLTSPFRKVNPEVRVIEYEIDQGKNFLTRTKEIACDLVICNPPFDQAIEFFRQVVQLVSTTTPMVFIAPVTSVIGFQEKTWHALLRSPNCPRLTSITPLPQATFVGVCTPAVILWFNVLGVEAPVIPADYLVRSNEEFVPPVLSDRQLRPLVVPPQKRSQIETKVKLICGDALEQLRKLPSESIDCCVTSPPYFLLRDYRCKGQYGLEETIGEYISKLVTVFREVRRVVKRDGTLWVNIGDTFVSTAEYSDRKRLHLTSALTRARQRAFKTLHIQKKSLLVIPFRLAIALADDGWIARTDIPVEKNNPAPESATDRPSRTHEYVLFYAKSKTYYYDGTFLREAYAPATTAKGFNQVGDNPKRSLNPNGRNGGSVWRINNGFKQSDHPAPMPLELAVRCVLAGCPVGGTVLDPFVGSGTTALACVQNQRHCTGMDLNRAYLEMAMQKVPGARIVTR